MTKIKDIDVTEGIAVVQPGVKLAELHSAVEAAGWFYPPDPNSLQDCAIGGNVATNAAGPRAFKYGPTRDYVVGLNACLVGGETLTLGHRTRKGVTGYDVTSLVVGSEGTLAVVSEIPLNCCQNPRIRWHYWLYFLQFSMQQRPSATSPPAACCRAVLSCSMPQPWRPCVRPAIP